MSTDTCEPMTRPRPPTDHDADHHARDHGCRPRAPRLRRPLGEGPREFGFLILTMPIAIIGLSVLATVFFTGLGLVTIFVGIFLLIAALYIARGFGTLELVRLRWAGRPEIRRPNWARDGREQGFWRSAFSPVHRRALLAVPAAHARREPDRERRHVEHHHRVDLRRARRHDRLDLAAVHPRRRPHVLAERVARRPDLPRQRLRVRPGGRASGSSRSSSAWSSSPRSRSCTAG